MNRKDALVEVLLRLFNQEELLILLSRYDHEIVAFMPAGVSQHELSLVAVGHLERRGMITQAFFDALRQVRPHRIEEIDSIANLWLTQQPASPRADEALLQLGLRFFDQSGQSPTDLQRDRFIADNPVSISLNTPPDVTDIASLSAILSLNQRGYFLYRGELPLIVQDRLNDLRLRGNPIAPLDAETMRAAVEDGDCPGVLAERERTYFTQQNLFSMTNALVDRQFFFGREGLLTRIGTSLAAGDSVLLTGIRKSGKTSLLRILRYHLSEHPWCAIDLQMYHPERDREWPLALFAAIIRAFDAWGKARFPRWPDSPNTPRSSTEFAAALQLRRQWQRERGRREKLILVLDEVERVFPTPGKPERVDAYLQAAGALRAQIQAGGDRPLALIAADLRTDANHINLLPGQETNPLYRFLQTIPLPPLSRAEVSKMLHTIGAMMGIKSVSEDFISALYSYSGGHPALTRQIAAKAYDLRSVHSELRSVDHLAALEKLEENYELGHFFEQNLWLPMSLEEQSAVIQLIRSTRPGWRQKLSRWLGAEPAAVSPRILAALRSQGILDGDRVAIGGFGEWLLDLPQLEAASK